MSRSDNTLMAAVVKPRREIFYTYVLAIKAGNSSTYGVPRFQAAAGGQAGADCAPGSRLAIMGQPAGATGPPLIGASHLC